MTPGRPRRRRPRTCSNIPAAWASPLRQVGFILHRWAVEGVWAPFDFSPAILTWHSFMGMLIYGMLASLSYTMQIQRRLR